MGDENSPDQAVTTWVPVRSATKDEDDGTYLEAPSGQASHRTGGISDRLLLDHSSPSCRRTGVAAGPAPPGGVGRGPPAVIAPGGFPGPPAAPGVRVSTHRARPGRCPGSRVD